MSSEGENASSIALRLLDGLLLRNPERTALGGMLGLSLYGLFGVLHPILTTKVIALGTIDWWAALCLGVVIVHLPFIKWSIRRRPLVSDEVENLIKLIESANITEAEKRNSYRRIVNKCVQEFSPQVRPGSIQRVIRKEIVEHERVTTDKPITKVTT